MFVNLNLKIINNIFKEKIDWSLINVNKQISIFSRAIINASINLKLNNNYKILIVLEQLHLAQMSQGSAVPLFYR
jgi:hypothetical protein